MDQQLINQTEWQNPDNWLSPKFLGIYASHRDNRFIVPKRNPVLGWTVNFGHRYGPPLVFGLAALAVGFALLGWFFSRQQG